MPKKSGLINDREKAIGARVKQLREELDFSQPAFARELNITLDQLAGIEYGRAPLRYALGAWLCWRFDVNQRWLAEGLAPQHWCILVAARVLLLIHPQTLFSEAYDKFLKAATGEYLQMVAEKLGCAVTEIRAEDAHWAWAGGLNHASRDIFEFILCRSIHAYLEGMPPQYYGVFYRHLREARDKLAKEFDPSLRAKIKKTKGHKPGSPLFAAPEFDGGELIPLLDSPPVPKLPGKKPR